MRRSGACVRACYIAAFLVARAVQHAEAHLHAERCLGLCPSRAAPNQSECVGIASTGCIQWQKFGTIRKPLAID